MLLLVTADCFVSFSRFPHGLCSSSSCLFPQHVPGSESYLPNRLLSRCPLQSVLLSHQRGGASVLALPQPLSDRCVSRAKCLPPAEPIRSARHILHAAPVRGATARHPPHHGGPAQRHAGDRVPSTHPSAQGQRGHHGHGGRDHDGHVSRYSTDSPLPNTCRPPPRHCAHVSGPRNTHLQLCAPPVVITLQRFKEGTGGSHGGSTAGAAGCVPPTRTFFVMLSTLS